MAVSVSVSSQTTSQKKAIWAWVVSEKNSKFGSAQTDSSIVGNLLAVHSALLAIPGHLDVIIRTQYNSVAEILNDPEKDTKNPLVLKIFQIIRNRPGRVTTMVLKQVNLNENDKRAYKMTSVISNNSPAKKKPAAGSLLSPSKSSKVKVSVSAKKPVTKRRKPKEVLITGLEDDYDTPFGQVTQPAAEKPVLCDSCDGPINPLTFECFCSA
jgi:hypothetical protein